MSRQAAAVPKKKRGLMELMKRREGQRGLVIVLFMAVPLTLLLTFTYYTVCKDDTIQFL